MEKVKRHIVQEYSYVSFGVKRTGDYDVLVMIPSFVSESWQEGV